MESLHIFCKQLPKIELHAHLNGSIRETTLVQLAAERSITLPTKLLQHAAEHHDQDREALLFNTKSRSLEECFEIFGYIPRCVNDVVSLKRITVEILEDFANDTVAYVEVRTGPKLLLFDHKFPEKRYCTKEQYVETILDVMSSFEVQEQERYVRQLSSREDKHLIRLPLIPRLIISIDRSGTFKQAEENINLAIRMAESHTNIVGVELGGNPTRNDFRLFEPLFRKARDHGLKVSIHCGEIPTALNDSESSDPIMKAAYEEAEAVLNFRPDRLGHALLLPDVLMKKLMSQPIPIECCPTSNVMTLELALHYGGSLVDGMKRHPQLGEWIRKRYPFSINTDDSGIFCTNLTKEFLLVAKAFHVSEDDLLDILIRSIDHIFERSKLITEKLKMSILDRVDALKRSRQC
jgi:adenosine deaminase